MKTDINGCSTCPIGSEQYEHYHSALNCIKRGTKNNCNCIKGTKVQYDYRHTNGKLFSTIANTLEICRKKRDKWLSN